jgi:hypothetical protein
MALALDVAERKQVEEERDRNSDMSKLTELF